jgi:hypothetical protein
MRSESKMRINNEKKQRSRILKMSIVEEEFDDTSGRSKEFLEEFDDTSGRIEGIPGRV